MEPVVQSSEIKFVQEINVVVCGGYCGVTSKHCDGGCQINFGRCNEIDPMISYDGTCDKQNGNKICPDNQCCSSYGYCGVKDDYCNAGCQIGFGRCNTITTTTIKTIPTTTTSTTTTITTFTTTTTTTPVITISTTISDSVSKTISTTNPKPTDQSITNPNFGKKM